MNLSLQVRSQVLRRNSNSSMQKTICGLWFSGEKGIHGGLMRPFNKVIQPNHNENVALLTVHTSSVQ
jgi:hypothetical protein